MCAGSEAKLRDDEVDVYMGYYGGSITVGDVEYSVGNGAKGTKEELTSKLMKYKKEELANLIADLIENAEEG